MEQEGSQEKQKNILTIHSDSWLLTPDSLPRRGGKIEQLTSAMEDLYESWLDLYPDEEKPGHRVE